MTSIETSARATGTIERAVNVLREATALKGKVQTRGVGLALWVLRGRCPDEWLVAFWEAAGSDHKIGRAGARQAPDLFRYQPARQQGQPAPVNPRP